MFIAAIHSLSESFLRLRDHWSIVYPLYNTFCRYKNQINQANAPKTMAAIVAAIVGPPSQKTRAFTPREGYQKFRHIQTISSRVQQMTKFMLQLSTCVLVQGSLDMKIKCAICFSHWSDGLNNLQCVLCIKLFLLSQFVTVNYFPFLLFFNSGLL